MPGFYDPNDPFYRTHSQTLAWDLIRGAGGIGAQPTYPGAVSSPDAMLGILSDAGLGLPVAGAYGSNAPPAQGSGQTSAPPPAEDRPAAAAPAPEAPPRDPLCSASIEYLRAHGVPGKPDGWLQRVERELCSPDLAGYDIPICPERQVMKFGTTYTKSIDGLGSLSAGVRDSARRTLETGMRAAPFNRGLLPGPDGVLRRERQCAQILGPRPAGTPTTPPIAQIPPADDSVGALPSRGPGPPSPRTPTSPPESSAGGAAVGRLPAAGALPAQPGSGRPALPMPRMPRTPPPLSGSAVPIDVPPGPMPPPEVPYQHPTLTAVLTAQPGIRRSFESPVVENGLVWDVPELMDPAGFMGILDPSDIDSAGMYSYRPSQGGLPYDPSATGAELPAANGSLIQLRSTSDFRVVFDETGDIWSAYS